jgi:hypothetical protein
MSHIDTLEVYERYRASGLDETTAREYTSILENSFMTKVNELKSEFVSSKMLSIVGALVGTILITLNSFTLSKIWDLSHDMVEVKSRLTFLEQRIK